MNPPPVPVLGIDVSNAKLHVALLVYLQRRANRKVVANTLAGYEELSQGSVQRHGLHPRRIRTSASPQSPTRRPIADDHPGAKSSRYGAISAACIRAEIGSLDRFDSAR